LCLSIISLSLDAHPGPEIPLGSEDLTASAPGVPPISAAVNGRSCLGSLWAALTDQILRARRRSSIRQGNVLEVFGYCCASTPLRFPPTCSPGHGCHLGSSSWDGAWQALAAFPGPLSLAFWMPSRPAKWINELYTHCHPLRKAASLATCYW